MHPGLLAAGDGPVRELSRPARAARPVALWLLVCCAMIFVMVVLGGVTRLTHSGLSMVEWKPVTGLLPPLSEAGWQQAFERYRQYPEYRALNFDMTLEGFKAIFWLEYVHRIWGRLIGVVFLLPFLWFLARGRIGRRLAPHLAGIFVLGGLQGLLGWYMVKSGLVDQPDVSQYRLAAHLGLAVLIYGYALRVALGLLRPPPAAAPPPGLRRHAALLLGAVFLTLLSGGFVAGLDAGFAYNTFPLMGGRLVPAGLLALEPPLRNLFENIVTVQFTHRLLAVLVLVTAVALWLRGLRAGLPARARLASHCLLGAVLVQVSLGVSTLLLVVPVPLAAAHQAGALMLFSVVLWLHLELRAAPAAAGVPGAA